MQHLQGFFTDGLVTVVGLGHSAANGLPTMPALAEALRAEMPRALEDGERAHWEKVEGELEGGAHLEAALDAIAGESAVTAKIVTASARAITLAEAGAIEAISRSPRDFAMARLMKQLAFNGRAEVITTNYDRLVELGAEIAGLRIDTGFCGAHYGRYEPAASHEALRSAFVKRKDRYRASYRDHLMLAKPHGSLDWYEGPEGAIRSPYALDLPRLMITPGEGKYRSGYEPPFDHHIALANRMIDRAAAVLAIGFGFNDPHLQTHLVRRIERGLPTLILTQALTPAATELLACPSVTAITAAEAGGSWVSCSGEGSELPDSEIWQLNDFLKEVLNE
jgi:hypothetical protein